jgi:hypothetical protein
MEFEIILLSAAAAWTADDWCPTPPRPPWPWPWFLRKILAVIGGIGLVALILPAMDGGVDLVSTVLIAAAGGVTLASLVGHLADMARPGAINRPG